MDAIKLECLLKLLILLKMKAKKNKVSRRWWIRPFNRDRRRFGFERAFNKMKISDPEQFFIYTRMNASTFDHLLNLLRKRLTKLSIRTPLSPQCRLAITLMFLSQGTNHQIIAWCFRVGKSTIRMVINETTSIVWEALKDVYVRQPTMSEYKDIADDFYARWNFPNVLGSIDGKHFRIKCPPNSGSEFYNYKGFFSIVLMACCDAQYKFRLVDVGAHGSENDSGIFSSCAYGNGILNGTLNVPLPKELPGTQLKVPLFFVGDGAFPLRTYLMKPYPGRMLSKEKTILNYRLSRARRTIENAFGILQSRWRIFSNTIEANPQTATNIVLATVALHNFIMMSKTGHNLYCPAELIDRVNPDGTERLGSWRFESFSMKSMNSLGSNNASKSAFKIRDTLNHYVNNEGKVSWQYNMFSELV